LIFTFPHPDNNTLTQYYSENYFKHWFEYTAVKEKTDLWRLNLVNNYVKNDNINLLDFGSGLGYFLNKANTKFPQWKLCGIEYSDFGIKYATEKFKLNVLHYNDIDALKNKFDVITMWHTIEHLNDPDRIIIQLKNLLHNKGILFIETPNVNSILIKLRGLKSLNLIEHLYHYTPESIQYLLMKHDFKILLNRPGNPGYTRKGIKIFIKKNLSRFGKFIFNILEKNYDDTILIAARK